MNFIKHLLIIVLLTPLASCSLSQISSFDLGGQQAERLCTNNNGELSLCKNIQQINKNTLFQPNINFQSLGEYTEQMVYVIYKKISVNPVEKLIAVPPFISSPPNEGKLAIELAELFIADMQNIGLPVAENILTYSESNEEANYLNTVAYIQNNEDVGYILKGTIRENNKGIIIYAKIINVESKAVIASTSKLIPHYLLNKLAS
ncbi:MAG: FlgO family outer membrane protein [Thalassotalea sp.]